MSERQRPEGDDYPTADMDRSAPDVEARSPGEGAEPPGVGAESSSGRGEGPGAGAEPGPGPGELGMDPDIEIVDGYPVLAEVRTVERATPASLPTVQVAAVAATGFVAGAATVALVKRRTARKMARAGRGSSRRAADMLPIAATRSFLVDVHVIAKPD